MKITGIAIFALALMIGIAPQFLDCHSQGHDIVLGNGFTTPMACHWTAIAEIGMAIPLAATGGLSAFSRRKETRRNLAILGIILGAFVILFPTALIGVCKGDMLCNTAMRPLLILGGGLVMVLSGIMLIPALRKGADPEL